MQIDWFTFFAQIVNFLILVLLLRHFLYGPVTRAMDARESMIADRFHEAEDRERLADEEIERYRAKRDDLAEAETQILADAETEAEARRRTMISEARAEVETMMSRWYEDVEHERETLMHEIRERLGIMVVKLADQVLTDVADGSLERQASAHFVERLQNLPPGERHALVESGGRFDQDVIVCSASRLPYAERQQIIETLGQLIDDDTRANGDHPQPEYPNEIGVRFEETPDLLCGVELRVRDRRVAWSVRDYLDELDEEIEASLTLAAEPA